jgi:MYXO-CTERM domain-containing protein
VKGTLAIVGLLAALLAAMPVQAQAPNAASSVEIDLDAGPVGIPLGGGHEFPFQITLSLSNVVCTQASTATVALSIEDKPSPLNGVKATVPATLTFDVPQGNYLAGVPGTSPFSGTQDVLLSINVSADAPADHEHAFAVTGTYNGQLTGCQPIGTMPTAEGTAEHQIKTGPATAQGTAARGASQTQSTAPSNGDSKGAPALPWLALVGVLAVVALRRR